MKPMPSKLPFLWTLVRYGIASFAVGIGAFWHGVEPPALDMKQAMVDEGIYSCHLTPNRSVTGSDAVNGQPYATAFSYIFGIHTPTPCVPEINQHRVRVLYIQDSKSGKRLLLEIFDIETGRLLGVDGNKKFSMYEQDVGNKWVIYLIKLGLIFIAMRLTIWDLIKNVRIASSRDSKKV